MATDAPRFFRVGETIHFLSRVSVPGTKTPTDPDVVQISSLQRAGVELLVAPIPLVRDRAGEYSLVFATDGYEPGTYRVVILHSSGPSKVTMTADRFILKPMLDEDEDLNGMDAFNEMGPEVHDGGGAG